MKGQKKGLMQLKTESMINARTFERTADSRTIESKPKHVHRIIKEKSKQMCTVCHNSQREGGNEREEEMPKS